MRQNCKLSLKYASKLVSIAVIGRQHVNLLSKAREKEGFGVNLSSWVQDSAKRGLFAPSRAWQKTSE